MAFDDELDQAIERKLSCGEISSTLGSELSSNSPELEELVCVAAYLRATAPTGSAVVQRRVWDRVCAGLEEPVPLRQRFWARARAGLPALSRVAAVLVVLLVMSGAAVGAAAANSTPDDALYPLKLTWEQGQVQLASDPYARAELELSFAKRRLEEVVALEQAGKNVSSTALDAMLSATARASKELQTVDDPNKKESVGADFANLTSQQEEVLSSLLERAPDPAKGGLQRALEMTQKVKGKANKHPEDKSTRGPDGAPGQEKRSGDLGKEKRVDPPGQEIKPDGDSGKKPSIGNPSSRGGGNRRSDGGPKPRK